MEHIVYNLDLLKTIQMNSGKTIEEIKAIYLKNEPDCVTAAKAGFDNELENLKSHRLIKISDDKVIFVEWPYESK